MDVHADDLVFTTGELQVNLTRRTLHQAGIPVLLGSRAFEILELLVRSGGELVAKETLLERIWPGLAVSDNTLQVHISAVRKALGVERTLLRTVSGRGYRLLGAWSPSHAAPGQPAAADRSTADAERAHADNLPADTAELIGRAEAVTQLCDLAAAHPVVTLVGPGGIGKTRLALAAARMLLPDFGGDVRLVELAPLAPGALVAATIARGAGLAIFGEQVSAGRVAQEIGARKLLLVLDSCEHVIVPVANATETLASACPNLIILATSREPLNIECEFVHGVPPLVLPPENPLSPDETGAASAVQLFIARTRALRADFDPGPAELAVIAAICRQLDGIPLAIEFAASRAAAIGLASVLEGLPDMLGLLSSARRTALPRQRTLRATLDWSHALLSAPERNALRRLGVFPGGFTIAAATAVMGGAEGSEAADLVSSLVAKSLLVLDRNAEPSRWRMLHTTRAYALEKLVESGEVADAHRRQAAYLNSLLTGGVPGQVSSAYRERMAQHAREIDNIRHALDWAFGPGGDARLGVLLTAAFAPVWLFLFLGAECNDRIAQALARLRPDLEFDPAERLNLLTSFGTGLLLSLGTIAGLGAIITEALDLAVALGDREQQFVALWDLWLFHTTLGEQATALAAAERNAELARAMGERARVLIVDRAIGTTQVFIGDLPDARTRLERFLDEYTDALPRPQTTLFYKGQRVVAATSLARALWLQGHVAEARSRIEDAMEMAQSLGEDIRLRFPLTWGLIPIAMMTGDLDAAQAALDRLLALGPGGGPSFWNATAPALQGALLIRRGDAASGTAVLEPALRACVSTGWTTCYPQFLAAHAEGLVALGRDREAADAITEALAWSERTGERWYVPELMRLRGEFLLGQDAAANRPAAERCFRAAAELAQQQTALFWELRAAVSLARLHEAGGTAETGRRLLARICQRFAPHQDTDDLRTARAMAA